MTVAYSDYNPLLKTYYAEEPTDVTFQNNAALALVPKFKQLGGLGIPLVLKTARPPGVSADLPQSLKRARAQGTQSKAFLIDGKGKSQFGCASIPNQVIEASLSDKVAFMKIMTTEMDGIISANSHVLNTFIYGRGYGKLGVIGSISGKTITLATPEDALNFEVGYELDLSTDEDTSALEAVGSSGNGLIITGVSFSNGVGLLIFGSNVTDATNGIPTAAANDTIFLRGCRSTTPTIRLVIDGFGAWCPRTAPVASESFHGVDRSGNTRLYGQYLDGRNKVITELLVDADQLVSTQGGKLSHFLMHPKVWAEVAKLLEGKVVINKDPVAMKNSPTISFPAIGFAGMNGEIKMVMDRSCPVDTIWGLELESWTLYTTGDVVHPWVTDGNTLIRGTDVDTVEYRSVFYGELGCKAPGHNIQIQIA